MELTLLLAVFGLIVALIIGGWQIYLARKQVEQSRTNQESTTPNISKVRIVDWSGPTAYPSDNLFVELYGCLGDDAATGANCFVIFETWIALTLVADGDMPNAIVRIDPIYNTDYERQWKLNVWHITAHKDYRSDERVAFPIELPTRVPKKIYFRAIHVVHSNQPNTGFSTAARLITEYGPKLSPLRWTFKLLDQEQIVHTSELSFGAPEAVDDGKFKFSKRCKEKIDDWPIPIPSRG